VGRSLNYQDAHGAFQPIGDMNEAEFERLKEMYVFRVHYFNHEANEYGLYVNEDMINDAATMLCSEEPVNADLMLLLFRIATWPQQDAFFIW